jgi:inner membrane protein
VENYFVYWVWFVAAVVLAGGELALPGIFLIWLAGAAAVTGVITWATGISWEAQLAVFAVLGVVSVYIGRAWFKRIRYKPKTPASINVATAWLVKS